MYLFPDFDYPEVLKPDTEYPSGKRVHEYIKAYANEFKLFQHIQFNSKLVQLRLTHCGQWNVLYLDTVSDQFFQIKADYVVLCTGIYNNPYIPNYEVSKARQPPHAGMHPCKQTHDACAHASKPVVHLPMH